MLQLQWESQRPFLLVIIWQFRLLTNRISRSFLVLYHTLVLPDIATSIIIVSFFTLSTTTISGHLDSIM